jgi:hypothetical protein
MPKCMQLYFLLRQVIFPFLPGKLYSFNDLFFLVVLGFELRVSFSWSWCSTSWVKPLVLHTLVISSWPWTAILLMSACQVVTITGMRFFL